MLDRAIASLLPQTWAEPSLVCW